ncbi:MAG: trypsin-like peptidase domain-containing protein [Myxococcales bacterium]|nr:trypsin-like peptidase domain-containing protein [Myxococcales bacterium]MCB9554357.1 trypsin-like peptidase domain-containing protein [Myxococcales bacterium]
MLNLSRLAAATALLIGLALPAAAAEPLWTDGTKTPVIDPGAPLTFDAFSRIAARTAPAVVTIETEGDGATFRAFHPFLERGAPDEPFTLGAGSGFIIRDDGYILSNNHVIEKAKTIKVHLQDGREYAARLVGRDPATDLSLLKIDAQGKLPTVPLGDSDQLQIGEWVVAIGNPMGLSHTVTVGIVSAKGRREVRLDDRLRYADFIQTDASINPGNSGGPLFNLQGEVIGINTAINAHAQGIGFAVPINMVKTVLPALKDKGQVERSWLGIQIGPVTVEQAKTAGLERPTGALVSAVVRQGPAELAGLRAGDVIVRFGDRAIERHDDLPWIASNAGVGETIALDIRREGRERTLRVTLGKMPGFDRDARR